MPASEQDINAFLKAKRDCLDQSYNSGYVSTDDSNVCPTEWDGYVCWRSTEAGQSATVSCPKLITSGADEKLVTRLCTEGGRWQDIFNACKKDESTTLLTTMEANSTAQGVVTTMSVETTLTEAAETTVSGVVDDMTAASPASEMDLGTVATSHEMVASHGGFIYDYYKEIDIIRALVNCVSVVLLVVAISFWFAIWCRSRHGHPYRSVSLICILIFSLLYHSIGVMTLLLYVPDGLGCQCVMALRSYADIGMYTFCFLYVILCIGIAMRRLESGAKFYCLVVVAAILPLILVVATATLRILKHPDAICDLLDELAHYLWYDRAPKTFLLFGAICVLAVILYWLFCFDNTVFKLNRDFLLIRHSSVTLMILVCFCFFLELYEITFLRRTVDGQIKSQAMARNGLILNILMSAKGSLAAALLCFFDIEIFSLIYSFPCCPDLDNAIIDQTWEKRIRSESKVKFFEDSSSDDSHSGQSGGHNPFVKFQENEKVLPEPKAIQGYGSVDDDINQTQ